MDTDPRSDKPSESSLRFILESVPVGIVQLDEQRRYLWANSAFLAIVGYTLEELRGLTMFDITHPEDRAASTVVSDKLLNVPGFQLKRFEKRYVRKDGTVVWVQITSQHVRNPATGEMDTYTVVEDISELKRREVELQRAEKEMSSFFRASVDIMCSFDFEGTIKSINPAGLDLLGIGQDEFLGKSVGEYVHPDDREPTRREVERIANGAITLRFENRALSRDGTYHTISWTAVPDHAAGLIYAVGRDVTERRREQASLAYSAKMASLGEMAGGIAHEVNNPLAIILGKLTTLRLLLEQENPDLHQVRDDLVSMDRTGQRIVNIIRGLRAFSRDSERDPMSRVSITSIMDDTLALCGERLKAHRVDLKISCPADLYVRGRATQLSQVLMNLISNAFDAIEARSSPWIRVEALRQQDLVILRVTDSGPGVDAKLVGKIFQPFFTTKEIGKGTGLGLSISKGIIEEHGGSLRYENAGGHASFVIELPAYWPSSS